MKLKSFTRLLTPYIIIILSLVLVFPLFAGCGGTASNTFLELMNLVPADYAAGDGEHPVYFTIIDYASIYQDAGITLTTPEELFEKIMADIFVQRVVVGSFITGYGSYAYTSSIRKEYVGYDITCIDAEIQFGYPPTDGVAAIGRFDPQATKDAFSHQSEWPSWAVADYAAEEYRGVTIHSWGDGFKTHLQTRLVPPHIDMLGRARPLAVTEKYLFYTAAVELLEMSIDASQNQHSSLADLPEYAAIANGLAELKVYNAIIGDAKLVNGMGPLLTSEQLEQLESQRNKLKNFLTFGSGAGQDEKGTYTALVLYHENTNDALQNVSLLKQRIENDDSVIKNIPWRNMITDFDIRAEGKVLLAKLYTSASFWSQLVYSQDNLLLHE